MNIRAFIDNHIKNADYDFGIDFRHPASAIVCNDGATISVQANKHAYCKPRTNFPGGMYESYEIGYPSDTTFFEMDDDVKGWVGPEEIVAYIVAHGGVDVDRTISGE
jgi:hypothetical protein